VTSPDSSPVWFRFIFVSRCARPVAFLGFLLALSLGSKALGVGPTALADHRHNKPYAVIFGTVWGPGDRPVYGVSVKIRLASQKKAHWQIYSDHHGEFAQRVPAGKADYVIWADLEGYKPADGRQLRPAEEVTVHVEYDERVDTGVHLK